MRRPAAYGFAVLGGAAIAVAGAPLEAFVPALLAPACFMVALMGERGDAIAVGAAARRGMAMGFTVNLLTMYWIVGLLESFAGFPTALAVLVGSLLWLGQSLSYVLAAAMASALSRRRLPLVLGLPLAWTLTESLTPKIFPWHFGLSQLPNLAFVQMADLGGMPLVDLALALGSCALVEGLRTRRRWLSWVAALAWLVPLLYGSIRLGMVEADRDDAPARRIGIVQPNVGIREKMDPQRQLDHLIALRTATRALEDEGAWLVVWPESSYPFPFHRQAARDREGPLAVLGDGVRGPVLFGVITTPGRVLDFMVRDASNLPVATFRAGEGRRYNSTVAIAPGGRMVGRADKVRRLAFGEYTPLWEELPWLQRFPPGIAAGHGPQIVEVDGVRLEVLNCYEDLLSDYVRAQVRRGRPDLLVNVTNDAWFGNTSAPHLHHMNARMRAIETRRDLVRAVNTGVSGHTAATGRDTMRTPPFVAMTRTVETRLLRGTTPYVRLGDWVSPAIAGGLLAFVLASRRRRSTGAFGRFRAMLPRWLDGSLRS